MILRLCYREDFHFTPYSTISYLVPGISITSIQPRKESSICLLKHSSDSFQQMFRQFSGNLILGRKRLLSNGATTSSIKQTRTGGESENIISAESSNVCSIDLTKDGGVPILIDDSDDDFL